MSEIPGHRVGWAVNTFDGGWEASDQKLKDLETPIDRLDRTDATRDALARAIVAWQEAHFYPADMTVERWREALDAALGPINESEE